MRLVVYSESGEAPDWLHTHPYRDYSKIIGGPSQSAAILQYMVDQYDQPTELVMMFMHVSSPDSMVKEIGYDLTMATSIMANNHEKALFRWFWPIGVIGVCDHEGYPHQTSLPLRQMFELAEIKMPPVIHFIFDQTFAIKHETLTSVRKGVYEALLASQGRFGASWGHCITRLWLSLYRSSNTRSSL
jgi:hypothetical protein